MLTRFLDKTSKLWNRYAATVLHPWLIWHLLMQSKSIPPWRCRSRFGRYPPRAWTRPSRCMPPFFIPERGQFPFWWFDQLYLIHWPCAFKSNKQINNLFPLQAGNNKLVEIDDDISIVETWTGMALGWPKQKTTTILNLRKLSRSCQRARPAPSVSPTITFSMSVASQDLVTETF